MIYRLYSADDGQARSAVAETDMPSSSAALDWAQSWLVNRSGNKLYSIESADGSLGATFVRTGGGQWYAIGQDRG